MSALRKVVSYAWCALAVGGGLGLWYIVVPSEERKKEMVKVIIDYGSAGAGRYVRNPGAVRV